MKLTFRDRIAFFQLYPDRANIITLRLVRDLKDKIDFNAKEIDEYKIKFKDGNITWDLDLNDKMEFAVSLTNSELEFIKDRVRELDNSKSIPFPLLSLCEKINKESLSEKSDKEE